MVWTEEFLHFVKCNRPGEGSSEKNILRMMDVKTTGAEVIFRAK